MESIKFDNNTDDLVQCNIGVPHNVKVRAREIVKEKGHRSLAEYFRAAICDRVLVDSESKKHL